MKKFTCPYCYEKHDINDCKYKCSYNINGTSITCKHGYKDGSTDGTIPLKYVKNCMKCKDAKLYIYCKYERNGKLFEIPDRACDNNFSIALLGAKAAGKSNYIAVLLNEIEKKMSRHFDCSLISSNQQTQDDYQNLFYKPLYENMMVVGATDSGESQPLIYAIDFFSSNKNSCKITNSVTLTIYDTAGENLNKEMDMEMYNRYLSNANGIILLLDPLQAPSIRKQLEGKITLPDKNTDTVDILQRVVNTIRSQRKLKTKDRINISLALAFTKIDVLDKYGILPENSCLRLDSEHVSKGYFSKTDFENTNIEMQDLLDNLLDNQLTQLVKQFTNYAFFGVSSLGDNPLAGKIQGEKIMPKRVLDPLLWLLSLEKYIKTK